MKLKHLLLIPLIVALFSCVKEEGMNGDGTQPLPESKIVTFPEEDLIPGLLSIQLSEDAATRVAEATRGGGLMSGMPEFDDAIALIKTYKMESLFSGKPKFEARRRKAGLHLWFNVHYDASLSPMDAAKQLSHLGEIVQIVPAHKITMPDYKMTVADPAAGGKVNAPTSFNDPALGQQWHYNNLGDKPGFEAGADIRLFEAWSIQAGHPDVIVAVMDMGVDVRHEDLAQNMWVNPEDGSNGYNFVHDTPIIDAGDHGTHVAGTIAAVNNNGKGGAGVAGGRGGSDTGARIMSIEIGDENLPGPDKFTDQTKISESFVWAAEHGAVISNNSWGYDGGNHIDPILKAGIDYFIDYAGLDEYGVQIGPMNGGIVLAAIGNGDPGYLTSQSWPACYDRILAVANYGPAFEKSVSSCYGPLVDISAPGGDYTRFGQVGMIFSTIPGNQYAMMEGTSMACPHVSGVAALVVSQLGTSQPGFTNDALWDILIESVLDVDINEKNPSYSDLLGAGYIDASKAVRAEMTHVPPTAPEDLWGAWQYDSADITWTVQPDGNKNPTAKYKLLFSENDLAGADFDNPPADAKVFNITTGDKAVGAVLRQKVDELQPGTTYYVSAIGIDTYNNVSTPVSISGTTATTKAPNAVTDLTATFGFNNALVEWTVTGDDDGTAAVSYEVVIAAREFTDEAFVNPPADVTKKTVQVGSASIGDPLSETFDGLAENTLHYIAIAALNATGDRSPVAAITGTTQEDKTPEQTDYPADIYFPALEHVVTIDMSEYFTDDIDTNLSYEIVVEPASIVAVAKTEGSTYTFTSKAYGNAKVTITATDSGGKSIADELLVMCRDDSRPMDLYPNPVKDYMYIRLGQNTRGTADVKMYNSSGINVLTGSTNITTFEPGRINVSDLPSGNYTVVVTNNNKETKGSITKL